MDEILSMEEIEAEEAVSLPDKEVLSLLDLNANIDLGLNLAAPIDLAAAANLNRDNGDHFRRFTDHPLKVAVNDSGNDPPAAWTDTGCSRPGPPG